MMPAPYQHSRDARCAFLACVLVVALAGCATAPPRNPNNLCNIFMEKSGWYKAAKQATQRWGTPIQVQLAIIDQESGYHATIKPARTRLLWVIPWRRPSSAYGYTQALDSTWRLYQKKSGNHGASRSDFADSVAFVAWYVARSHTLLGISKWNAYSNYLAYYAGWGGYRRGTYKGKPWLAKTARRVALRAKRYAGQLNGCRAELEKRLHRHHWYWPF